MLTPQEVAQHAFSKASFGGYNMAMVDEFLDQVTTDYTTLYKENATLKAKMKVLADKVEEYRDTEDAMRKTLLAAQRMADQITAEAEAQKAVLLQQVEEESAQRMAALQQEIESERLRLTAARRATAEYVAKRKELLDQECDFLSRLSELQAEPSRADMVEDTAQAIAENVAEVDQPPVEEPTLVRSGSPAPAQEEAVEEPTRRLEFKNLQFGKNYEMN